MAVILGLTVLAGTSVRALVDWAVRRRRGERQAPAPRWAAACLILLGLAILLTGSSVF